MYSDLKKIHFPPKLRPIFEPRRFKSIRGGRDSGKSWGISRALLEIGASRQEFIVCARETMESIRDSVHRLLSEQITSLGLSDQYGIEKSLIWHRGTGTEFVFRGLRNPDALKSLEGATVAWIEEAQNVSAESWRKLIPTVRRPNSEIWLTWNPELDTDPTWQRFVVHPPHDLLEIVMNYTDNPWASKVLDAEREQCRRDDPEEFAYIWLGQCRKAVAGAIYANELVKAEAEGRIGKVEYDPALPVNTAWDLGWGDQTTCWLFQATATEYSFFDHIQGSNRDILSYLADLAALPYVWGTDYVPWDAESVGRLSGKSIKRIMADSGRRVVVIQQSPVHTGIDAVRRQFKRFWFDGTKCEDGVRALRHYRYGEIKALSSGENRSPTREPLHDWASHFADALRTMAMGVDQPAHGVVELYRQEAAALKIAKVEQSAFVKPVISTTTSSCPKCASVSIVAIGPVLDGSTMRETMRCGQCGNQWLR